MISGVRAGGTRLHAVLSISLVALAAIVLLANAESAAAKPLCQGQKATIKGTPDGETIKGTENADVIRARAGNDTILGLGGNDLVCSGKGADNADGAEGNDSVNGGEGNDQANGGGGDDRLVMHTGADKVNGGAGVDECRSDEHSECEADLRLNVGGPDAVTHGPGEPVYDFTLDLRNNGPTDALNTRVDVTLPQPEQVPVRQRGIPAPVGTVAFVPEESDHRCTQQSETVVRCVFGGLVTGDDKDATIGLRFPQCFGQLERRALRGKNGPPTVSITGRASDIGTSDHVGNNDADTHVFDYEFGPSCQDL